MRYNGIPIDLKVEALINYLPDGRSDLFVSGPHKRNAYEDIVNLESEENGRFYLTVGRKGLYDILPEALFHPVDRYDNIPANEYREKLKEEIRQQEEEEENARKYFSYFDNILLRLSSLVDGIREKTDENSFIADIIGDNLTEDVKNNRFVRKIWKFLPIARDLRGDRTMLAFVIRRILKEEGLYLDAKQGMVCFLDPIPRYNWCLDSPESLEDVFLGNEYDEEILTFFVRYWSEEENSSLFPDFITDLKLFEEFINDWFIGIENRLEFDLINEKDSVFLDDDGRITYLEYNTNL